MGADCAPAVSACAYGSVGREVPQALGWTWQYIAGESISLGADEIRRDARIDVKYGTACGYGVSAGGGKTGGR